jgi:hypothetical protein
MRGVTFLTCFLSQHSSGVSVENRENCLNDSRSPLRIQKGNLPHRNRPLYRWGSLQGFVLMALCLCNFTFLSDFNFYAAHSTHFYRCSKISLLQCRLLSIQEASSIFLHRYSLCDYLRRFSLCNFQHEFPLEYFWGILQFDCTLIINN